MRIKDTPKSNAEGVSKKESKRKNNKQKTETNVTKKKEKTTRQVKEKDSPKQSPSKDAFKVKIRRADWYQFYYHTRKKLSNNNIPQLRRLASLYAVTGIVMLHL